MGRLVQQVAMMVHGYVRKGGKDNRKQQAARMLAFACFCEKEGVKDIGQVGARHVVRYWKANRHLASATLYNHYRALCHLWVLSDKLGQPPAPLPENQLRDGDPCDPVMSRAVSR